MGAVIGAVPAPPPLELGGEQLDKQSYARFLSVCNWEVNKAKELLERDIKWRKKIKPRLLRQADMPNMCQQKAWTVLMRPIGQRRPPLSSITASKISHIKDSAMLHH